ncbi:MAG: hypothetical protein ACTMIX_08295, partial [Kluyvera intermedia]
HNPLRGRLTRNLIYSTKPLNCYENQRHTEHVIPLNALLEGRPVVNDRSTAQLKWISKEQNMAILQVEYK